MTIEAIRQSLTEAVIAAKVGFTEYQLNVATENRDLINPLSQVNPYLEVEIELGSGWQADLSPSPIHRISGLLILTVKCKEGSGSSQANRVLDFIYPKLQRKRIGLALTEMASFPKCNVIKGLYAKSVVIPFVADKVY